MASQAEKAPAAKTASGGFGTGRLILTGVLMLPVIAVLMPSCIVLAVHMAPTIAGYILDRSRAKYLAITVGFLNFCGALPAEVELWKHQQSYDAAMKISSDLYFLLLSYGAAAIAWALYLSLPPILSHYYAITSQTRLLTHRRKQKSLVDAWGEEVADGPS